MGKIRVGFNGMGRIGKNVMRFIEQSRKGIRQPPYEIEIFHKNGNIHRLEITEEPILNRNGQVIAVEGIAHDITQRIKTQEEREKLQKRSFARCCSSSRRRNHHNNLFLSRQQRSKRQYNFRGQFGVRQQFVCSILPILSWWSGSTACFWATTTP